MKARILDLVTVVLSTTLCLAAVEGLFAVLNARGAISAPGPAGAPGPGTELSRFTVYHPLLGHDGKPNVRGTFGRKVVTHNSKGNRGPEVDFAKPPGVRRVVVLGDSQAWGYGVHDDETIAARLSDLLNRGTRERYEVVNLGISAYGTDQSFLKFLVQGIRHSPDYVVFVVFKNDIHENESTVAWGVEKPRFFLKDGELCLGNVPPPKARGWPEDAVVGASDRDGRGRVSARFDLRQTQTYRFLARREWRWPLMGGATAGSSPLDDVRRYVRCIENRPSYDGSGEELLIRLFQTLDRVCRDRGARLLAFFTPKPKEVAEPSSAAYYEGIRAAFDRAGIASVDFREFVQRRSETRDLFGAGDPHLSASGSLTAARALADAILDEHRP